MQQLITVKIQPAKAYDELSVLYIKTQKTNDIERKKKIISEINTLENEIIASIGLTEHLNIVRSAEYHKLFDINLKTFEEIDTITDEDIKAKKIDTQNYERFLVKKELQKKFFTNELNEIKLGYNE